MNKKLFSNKGFKILISVIISIVFLFLAFRDIDFNSVYSAFVQAQYLWLLPAVFLYFLSMMARAWRWGYLLPQKYRIGLWSLHEYLVVGFASNNVFPLRLGEVIRAGFISKNENIPFGAVLTSVAVERLFDSVILLGLFAYSLIAIPGLPPFVKSAGYGIGTVAVVGTIICWLLWHYRDKALGFAQVLFSKFPKNISDKMLELLSSIIDGLAGLSTPYLLAMTFFSSLICWALSLFSAMAVLPAFGLDIGIKGMIFSFSFTAFGIAIPSAPGFLGTFHLACRESLVLLGVDKEIALCYAVLLHIMNYVYITSLGAVFFLIITARKGGAVRDNEAQ